MPEHRGGIMWVLLEGEYLPLPDNLAIVGPKPVHVHEYGYDPNDECYLFSVQLYNFYDFCGRFERFEDYVKMGTPPPELKQLP